MMGSMGAPASLPATSDDRLSAALGALASPTRLQLLRALRRPRALAEIQIRAADDARLLARQTVREHLNKLTQVGMVSTREVDREYGDTVEFVANHQALYALSEEVRELARQRPVVELSGATVHGPQGETEPATGARLVLVKGLEEGATFDLRAAPAGAPSARSEWLVGRRRGVAVSLDFDPYVSGENARITLVGGQHVIEDVAGSRNGTSVNFRRLSVGERRTLSHGDVVGVGRCLLVFWT